MARRRKERLTDLLKQEISSVLFLKMQDPRLALCSITDLTLSSDFRHARVYVGVIGTPKHRDECLQALNAAGGFIRRELGKLDLKYIPTLNFYLDPAAEYSQHIDELLKVAKKDDPEP